MAEASGRLLTKSASSPDGRDQLSPLQVDELRQDLESRIAGEVRFDPVYRAMHCTDASVYQIMPLGVVMPKTAEDVVQAVKLCERHGASITARGGGTSQAGQAIGAGLQLDFAKHMNRVLDLDVENQVVRVEPGIVLDELNAELKPHGLQLPLDLSTSNRATIGGMLANNSSGTRSIVYGKTIDFVEELSVVLADASLVQMRRLSDSELEERSARTNREGACYRIVRDLASAHAEEIQRRYP